MSPSTTDLRASHHGDRSSGPTQLNIERASCVLGAQPGQRLLFAQYVAGKCRHYATGTPPLCGSWQCRGQATIEHRTRSRGTRSEAAGQVPLVVGSATREART